LNYAGRQILPAWFAIITTAEIAAVAPTISSKAPIAAAEATVTASTAILTRLGFVYFQSPAGHFLAIELFDGSSGLFLGRHLDEAEAARASGVTVFDDGRRFNRASLSEHFLELFAGGLESQVSYIQFHSHTLVFLVFPSGMKEAANQIGFGER
jgi:hypothetical protein